MAPHTGWSVENSLSDVSPITVNSSAEVISSLSDPSTRAPAARASALCVVLAESLAGAADYADLAQVRDDSSSEASTSDIRSRSSRQAILTRLDVLAKEQERNRLRRQEADNQADIQGPRTTSPRGGA